jgi:hypothetical protein
MEISQGNSLCSYLYFKLKCHVFHFIFSPFPCRKSENRRVEKVLPRGEGWHKWEGGGVGDRVLEEEYRSIKCVHM